MKFLADHDVYAVTIRLLAALGHDVATASQRRLHQSKDTVVLQKAREEQRIFLTRDRHFGGLVFTAGEGPGVIYLRILPSTQDLVHDELQRVLSAYPEAQLFGSFTVVEPGRHRIRKLK